VLLIITNQSDLACDYLILKLKELKISFKRLNTEKYGQEYEVNISVSNKGLDFQILFVNGLVLSEKDIDAVYFRQPVMPDMSSNVEPLHLEFANREIVELLRCLWRAIPQDKWLNHPKNLWLSSNKIEQLDAAVNLGFNIPDTYISIQPQSISKFLEQNNKEVVCKSIKNGFYPQEEKVWVATTQELPDDFIEDFNSYAKIPMTYQVKIPKKYDVRVTVVGNNVFATAIHSQEHTETKIDWRLWDAYDIDLTHEPIVLPEEIISKCLKITQYFHLNYSAIDLIRTPDDEYIFLEMNPNGQWAWIEQLVNYPIREAIIDTLGV